MFLAGFDLYLRRNIQGLNPINKTCYGSFGQLLPNVETSGRSCPKTQIFWRVGPLRDLFAQMINNMGYRVKVAANGSEALAMIEKEALKPDLLITDVVMPEMSGRVLVERLAQIQPGLKVIYMSGYTDRAIVHHGALDTQMPFLQKPFSNTDLAAKISEILNS